MDTTIKIAIYSEQEYVALFLKERIFYLLKELDMCNEHICLAYSEYTVLKKELQNNNPNLIFLNVESENGSGFNIAEEINYKEIDTRIIFISSSDELVFKSLTYFPFYFLRMKKVREELPIILKRYLSQWKKGQVNIFQYKINGAVYQINSNDIIYLTYYKHKITLVLLNGKKTEFRGRILDCEEQLKQKWFCKVNAGTIVNFRYCENLTSGIFTMYNGDKITVSRERRKNVEEKFDLCWKSEFI